MSRTHDMTQGSPTRSILSFALPLILGYLLQQMYQVIDAALVGRFIGVHALAAIGSTTSVMFLVMGFCNGVCAGFAIPVSQAFGGKDLSLMRGYVANAVRIGALLTIVLTVATCLLCPLVLRLLNTPTEIRSDAYTFLFIQFLAIPFTIGYNLLAGFIRALGNSKQPFYFLIASSLLNVGLDVIAILVLRWGVAGAAFATLASQAFSVWLCLHYIRRTLRILIPQDKERLLDWRKVRILLNNGLPMGLQFSITGIGIIMLQSANNALGTVCVAAFTAAMRVKYLFVCVFDNIGMAMATYCGQNIGARRMDRVASGVRASLCMMLLYFVFTFVLIYPFADDMMRVFVRDDATVVISYAARYMRINNYFYPILGLLSVLRYSLQGLGYSNLSMLSGVMELIARCGVSLCVVPMWGFTGVCMGDPMAWIAADIFLVPAFLLICHHLNKTLRLQRA